MPPSLDREALDHRWRRDFGVRGGSQQRVENTVAMLGWRPMRRSAGPAGSG